MARKRKPPFLSAAVMRRAFQARLLSLDASAKRITRVRVDRLGGFEDRSFRIRYTVTLRLVSGRTRTLRLRGSSELEDQTRRQAYEIMKYLWQHGFDAGPNQVARPITFFYHWHLLVYEEAVGTPLDRYIRRHQVSGQAIDRAAAWLAALHRNSPRTLRLVHTRAGRKQYWRKALDLLADTEGLARQKLVRVIRKTMAFEDTLARRRGRVLVHHDFHPGNILASSRALRVVDFTESRLSDPLVDVATFITQLDLQMKSLPVAQVRGWQKRFLRSYARHGRPISFSSPRAQRILRFMQFRIALQSYIGEYLLGRHSRHLQEIILHPAW